MWKKQSWLSMWRSRRFIFPENRNTTTERNTSLYCRKGFKSVVSNILSVRNGRKSKRSSFLVWMNIVRHLSCRTIKPQYSFIKKWQHCIHFGEILKIMCLIPPAALGSRWSPRSLFYNWGLICHFDPRATERLNTVIWDTMGKKNVLLCLHPLQPPWKWRFSSL